LLPGVRSASAVFPLPLSQSKVNVSFEIEGRPMAQSELPLTQYRIIDPDYFGAMGIPLLKGRDFSLRDDKKATRVVIINEAFAEKFYPGEDPIGKHIKPGIATDEDEAAMLEIIGVVGNVKHLSLSAEPDPECYVPEAQVPVNSMYVVVKTDNDPRSIVGP